MKFNIPSIGDQIRLTSDWEFVLHYECRNNKLWQKFSLPIPKWNWHPCPSGRLRNVWKLEDGYFTEFEMMLESGTVLTVDRIYIRKGAKGFDSITFNIPKKQNKDSNFAGCRFWVKLHDANSVEFEMVE